MQAKRNKFSPNIFWKGFIFGSLAAISAFTLLWYKFFAVGKQEYDQLELVDLTGKSVNLSKLSGHALVVNYWATWCKPCIEEFPSFQNANNTHKKYVTFIMISDDPIEKINKLIKNKNYGFEFYVSKTKLQFSSRPVTLFYNKNHELVYKHIGAISEEMLLNELNSINKP